jgi:hypothetical protein
LETSSDSDVCETAPAAAPNGVAELWVTNISVAPAATALKTAILFLIVLSLFNSLFLKRRNRRGTPVDLYQ